MLYSTKKFTRFPIAHRDSRHDGNCALLHGYSLSFHFTFAARQRNRSGHVVDFGSLKPFKAWLEEHFDHALFINKDDPFLHVFEQLEKDGCCKLRTMHSICVEETAEFVHYKMQEFLADVTNGRAIVCRTEVWEDDANSAFVEQDAEALLNDEI